MAVKAVNGRANWGKTYSGFSQALSEAGKELTKQGITILSRACKEWLTEQNADWPRGEGGGAFKSGYRGGDEFHPWYTGSLHDSMATAVTDGNRIVNVCYMPDMSKSGAQSDQTYKGRKINGAAEGQAALARASHVWLPGIQARLVIGVPYARDVNDSPAHAGFIDEFEKDFGSTMTSRISELRNFVIRTK